MDINVLASGSDGNAYVIGVGGNTLLLEAGIRISRIKQGLDHNISGLDGCLISHEHSDHARCTGMIMKAGVDCYMSKGTAEKLGVYGHRIHLVEANRQFRMGPWEILPFDTIHDANEPLGFLIANGNFKLLYATDTAYIKYRFSGLTDIMVEVNYALDILKKNVESGAVPPAARIRVMRSHMALGTAKQFFRSNDMSQVHEIHLLHLSNGNSDAARFKRDIQAITGKPVKIGGHDGEP